MSAHAAQHYLKAKVLTATPEQLQLMLYDGAIRFTEQAKAALTDKQYEQSHDLLTRAQRIITELTCGLKPTVAPELCARLSGLYTFCYRKLVEANVEHDPAALEEALAILRYQRETWAMLLQHLSQQKAAKAATMIDMPAPSLQMEASFSFQG